MSTEIVLDNRFMDSGIPVEELQKDTPAADSKRLREEDSSKKNNESTLTFKQRQAQESIAKGFQGLGLTEERYRASVTEAREAAKRNNGHSLSMDEVRANLRRIYLKRESLDSTGSSSNGDSKSSAGVFAENTRTEKSE